MTSRADYIQSIQQSLGDYCDSMFSEIDDEPEVGWERIRLEQLDSIAKRLSDLAQPVEPMP